MWGFIQAGIALILCDTDSVVGLLFILDPSLKYFPQGVIGVVMLF